MTFHLVAASCANFHNLRLQAVRTMRGRYVAELFEDDRILKRAQYDDLRQAQEWLAGCAQALTGDTTEAVVWKEVRLPFSAIALPFLACLLVLYGVPTLIEIWLRPFGGSLTNFVLGDLAAYLVLYFLGYKKIAVIAFLVARVTEFFLLQTALVSSGSILWVTDVIPSVLCSAVLCRKFFYLPHELVEPSA